MLQKFRIATDCQNVVKKHQGNRYMGRMAIVVQKIRSRIASFNQVEIVHESRMSNGDAHRLAKISVYEFVLLM
jgi:hypothetical protein